MQIHRYFNYTLFSAIFQSSFKKIFRLCQFCEFVQKKSGSVVSLTTKPGKFKEELYYSRGIPPPFFQAIPTPEPRLYVPCGA